MTYTPRNYEEALGYARYCAAHPTMQAPTKSGTWEGYCQVFVRTCYDVPALYGSAYAQWLGLDPEDRHVGGSPSDAPLGSALFFKGSNPSGHIDLAARPFKNGTAAAWSNDLVVFGQIDKVARTAPTTAWGQTYLGYGTAVNGYDLRLKEAKPPVPKQDKRYLAIDRAISKMEVALQTATKQNDKADIGVLNAEIAHLKRMYDNLRRH